MVFLWDASKAAIIFWVIISAIRALGEPGAGGGYDGSDWP